MRILRHDRMHPEAPEEEEDGMLVEPGETLVISPPELRDIREPPPLPGPTRTQRGAEKVVDWLVIFFMATICGSPIIFVVAAIYFWLSR